MYSRYAGLPYVVPAFALLGMVLFSPVFYGFWFSLFRIRYGAPTDFIGLGNFTGLLSDPMLGGIVSRSAVFTALAVLLTIVIALALALWIHRLGERLGFAVQMIVIVPWIISTVVATLLFRWVFVNDIGLALSLARWAGLGDLRLLNDPTSAMALLIGVSVWKRIGYAVIILLAGLKGIPDDYEEAARIDGATSWQIFRRITLPLMKTPLLLVAIVLTLSNLNTVETPLVLTGGGPGNATRILPIEVFDRAFVTYDLGSATALALAMFLGNILLVLAYVRLAKWKA
ncbi:carbohydrate ABC transporter permease [Bosea sp. (in: a-proteobacteria)]|uniref:carbohydrate ABC transporter permease n=1 Tax=Bosea sp. (in: a-proteobacteria) TaxID=1871050 RepID=UPI002630EC0E|nr:sugar ABC transporter permease [Bosea sp. (in: a-proteobacteria)]MCO5090993.1 sugar ABC transporter permease [Bosea sp. (in: a-proteobacteria)]